MEHSVPPFEIITDWERSHFEGTREEVLYTSGQLKEEDEDWTSADTSEDEGGFAPDKQVSATVQQQMSRRDSCKISDPM